MANLLGSLIVSVGADVSAIQKDLGQITNAIGRFEKDAKKRLAGFDRAVATSTAVFKTFAAGFAARFLLRQFSSFTREVVNVSAGFETLKTRLESITGSAYHAEKSFEWIKDFTQKTPFQLGVVSDAFNKLTAAGLDATETLPWVADAVSAIGGGNEEMAGVVRALQQMAAKGRVSAEELLQISERGIPAILILKEELGLTAKDMDNLAKAIPNIEDAFDALARGVEKRYGGAALKQMDKFVGLASNIKDQLTIAFGEVGDAGFLEYVKDIMRDILNDLNEFRTSGQLKIWAKEVSDNLISIVSNVKELIPSVKTIAGFIDGITQGLAMMGRLIKNGDGLFFQLAQTVEIVALSIVGLIQGALTKIIDVLPDSVKKIGIFKNALNFSAERTADIADEIGAIKEGMADFFDFIKNGEKEVKKTANIFDWKDVEKAMMREYEIMESKRLAIVEAGAKLEDDVQSKLVTSIGTKREKLLKKFEDIRDIINKSLASQAVKEAQLNKVKAEQIKAINELEIEENEKEAKEIYNANKKWTSIGIKLYGDSYDEQLAELKDSYDKQIAEINKFADEAKKTEDEKNAYILRANKKLSDDFLAIYYKRETKIQEINKKTREQSGFFSTTVSPKQTWSNNQANLSNQYLAGSISAQEFIASSAIADAQYASDQRQDIISGIDALVSAFGSNLKGTWDMTKGVASLVQSFSWGGLMGVAAQGISLMADNSPEMANALERINAVFGKVFALLAKVFTPFVEIIADTLESIEPILETIGSALGDIFEDFKPLLKIVADTIEVIADIIKGIGNIGENIGSAIGDIPVVGDIVGSIGGFFADGGRPPVGKVSVVGEEGAELFVPDTAGTIIPNDQLGNLTTTPTYDYSSRGVTSDETIVLDKILMKLKEVVRNQNEIKINGIKTV